MRPAGRTVPVAGLVVAALLTAGGCAGDQERYCGAVEDHRTDLARIIGSGDRDALIQALPILEDLRGKAPSDVADDYQLVTTRITALRTALEDAGVDPASYDRTKPPPGLDAAQRQAIDDAAKNLGDGTTLGALDGIDQEVRDVCHTPLGV